MSEQVDVVVVGAGPVGLLAAIELTLGGARVRVLERLGAPNTGIKALSVGPIGSEALQRRGMGAALAAAEARNFAAMERAGAVLQGQMSKFGGHFAGLLLRKDVQREPDRRARLVDQPGLEAILAERAQTLGIEVHRGCEVTGIAQHADGVDLECAPSNGPAHLRCSFLVGCDGGRSAVRKMAGFAFPGTPPTLTMYQAVVALDYPERLAPLGWHRTSGGVFAYGPFPDRLFMLDFSGPPADRDAPVTRDEVEAVLRRVSGVDIRVTAFDSANRWTDNTRLVDIYRNGRVLLAGDAAHVHSPFGGQGLSLGLVDAANLGWKLAAVLRGEMPDALLDTYTAERRPVAEAVLANTLAQVAIMRPDPQSGAMRDIVAKLLQLDDVAGLVGGMMNGLAVRYDLGSTADDVGRLAGDRRVDQTDSASLYDLMGDGRGVFLDADGGGVDVVAAVAPHVRCVRVAAARSMLIRPDACIAWAGDAGDVNGLEAALACWFNCRRQ